MALQDDVTRLTSILTRRLIHDGIPTRLRIRAKLDYATVGKACGVTGQTIGAWEDGVAQPSTAQALAWLTLLYDAQPSMHRRTATT